MIGLDGLYRAVRWLHDMFLLAEERYIVNLLICSVQGVSYTVKGSSAMMHVLVPMLIGTFVLHDHASIRLTRQPRVDDKVEGLSVLVRLPLYEPACVFVLQVGKGSQRWTVPTEVTQREQLQFTKLERASRSALSQRSKRQ